MNLDLGKRQSTVGVPAVFGFQRVRFRGAAKPQSRKAAETGKGIWV